MAKYTKEEKKWLISNIKENMTTREITEMFNDKWSKNMTTTSMSRFIKRNFGDIKYNKKTYKQNRRKFNKKMYDYLIKNGDKHTINEWVIILNQKYNETYNHKILNEYFVKNKVPFKREKLYISPIGAERPKKAHNKYKYNTTEIKVAFPNIWKYKHRYLYEQYHNVKLNDDDYIIFLDQDRTNFSKDNLFRVNQKELGFLYGRGMFSKNPKATELGVDVAKTIIKTIKKKGEYYEKKI